jgi:hypothetical protein
MIDSFFLDSGAFSAAKQGKPVCLTEYMDFIAKYKHKISHYAVLDVIGDWEASWKNQDIMEDQGFSPLPVFHSEDPEFCLDWCKEYPYFCLGGMAGNATRSVRLEFLDECWNKLTDKQGYPLQKVHGFGMASPELVTRYPWYSVDSSSPVAYARNGKVLVPRKRNGKFVYTEAPIVLFISERPSKIFNINIHLKSYSKMEQETIFEYFKMLNVPTGVSEIFKITEDFVPGKGETIFKKVFCERVIEEGIINSEYYRNVVNYIFYARMCAQQEPYQLKRFKKKDFLF